MGREIVMDPEESAEIRVMHTFPDGGIAVYQLALEPGSSTELNLPNARGGPDSLLLPRPANSSQRGRVEPRSPHAREDRSAAGPLTRAPPKC